MHRPCVVERLVTVSIVSSVVTGNRQWLSRLCGWLGYCKSWVQYVLKSVTSIPLHAFITSYWRTAFHLAGVGSDVQCSKESCSMCCLPKNNVAYVRSSHEYQFSCACRCVLFTHYCKTCLVSHTASPVSFQTECDKCVDFTQERVSSFGSIQPVIRSVRIQQEFISTATVKSLLIWHTRKC